VGGEGLDPRLACLASRGAGGGAAGDRPRLFAFLAGGIWGEKKEQQASRASRRVRPGWGARGGGLSPPPRACNRRVSDTKHGIG